MVLRELVRVCKKYLTEFMMILVPFVWPLRGVNGTNVMMDRERAAEKAATEFKIVPGH
jgi:hypothetical protein